jgi:hypothetical protein
MSSPLLFCDGGIEESAALRGLDAPLDRRDEDFDMVVPRLSALSTMLTNEPVSFDVDLAV